MITATAVSTATESPIDAQRPLVYPTATPSNFVALFTRIADVAVTAAGWIWFLCGSLIFFVTAGVLAGLGFRQRDQGRYAIVDRNESAYQAEVAPAVASHVQVETGPLDEDNWPTSLP